jgi:hypothetical protein
VPLTSLRILRKIAKLLARCNAMAATSREFRRNWSEEFIECEPERLYTKAKKGAYQENRKREDMIMEQIDDRIANH